MVDEAVPDFGFDKLHVGAREKAWLELPQLRGGIAVEGVFSAAEDSAYLNSRVASPTALTRHSTPDEIEKAYDNERRLYARHVLTGWRNVKDMRTGQPIPFSEGMALAFLRKIPNDVLLKVFAFFATRENFVVAREREEAQQALAGNSPAGSSGT